MQIADFSELSKKKPEKALLKPLKDLEVLELRGTPISDAVLPALNKLSHLDTLDLRGTSVTAAGVAGLQKALPQALIEF